MRACYVAGPKNAAALITYPDTSQPLSFGAAPNDTQSHTCVLKNQFTTTGFFEVTVTSE